MKPEGSTIFKKIGLHEDWESMMDDLTPWELRGGVWFKREDYYAPLGYGGPNGAKFRQLQHLFQRYRGNAHHVLTGASVLSPQHSMTAVLAAHYGLPSRHVVGSTTPETMTRHTNVAVSLGFGAEFKIINVGYNPALQAEVKRLTEPQTFVVPYGITRSHDEHPPEEVLAFHEVGARQVQGLPADLRRLVIPAGSCNTLASVLLGLSRDPGNLRMVYAVGIGPDRREWVRKRLRIMGVDPDRLPFRWAERSLHAEGVSYGDRVRASFRGITFHPTYEAKVWRHLMTDEPIARDGRTGFWIVGSEPSLEVARPHFTKEQLQ
jgi:hypothetical protein